MKYRKQDTDRRPMDKRTRRQIAQSGKRAFLNSCI
jgi:hypothetical protein